MRNESNVLTCDSDAFYLKILNTVEINFMGFFILFYETLAKIWNYTT